MPSPLSARAMLIARTTTTLRWRRTADRGSTMFILRVRNLLCKGRSECPTRQQAMRRCRRGRGPCVWWSEGRSTLGGAKPAEFRLAVPRKKRHSYDRTASSGCIAGRGQGRATRNHSPENCDQSVICRSSLGRLVTNLSTRRRNYWRQAWRFGDRGHPRA
jgi:hypothetical protein